MTFYIRMLGCPKNDVDADYIAGHLVQAGHVPSASAAAADALIINTCGFIEAAKDESIDHILELCRVKETNPQVRVYVAGCLAQRYSEELLREIPEIDGVFGLGELEALAAALASPEQAGHKRVTDPRFMSYLAGGYRHISDDLPYAYLKISDGCNRGCSYCVIPSIRGAFRSRPLDSILREATFLADNGKRELILVSQDATLYGQDLSPSSTVVDLLSELNSVPNVDWLRLLYLHPANTTEALIEYLGDTSNKALDYFDLPLQHINDEILSAMNRRTSRSRIERLLDRIRRQAPQATLRTTFIVGFPGETEKMFEELLQFVSDQRFDRAAAFTYSQEEGSPAAELGMQIEEQVKQHRLDLLMTLQQDIAFERNRSLIGTRPQVMLDRLDGENRAVGRTRGDCPEIDQEVIVSGAGTTMGRLATVLIEQANGYDLVGSIIED
ncbi:MAG: 30S ribosomal protein S12 methylthiotransferase RimO [bacterium]